MKKSVEMPTKNGEGEGLGEPETTPSETKMITEKGKKKTVCIIWSHLSMQTKLYSYLSVGTGVIFLKQKIKMKSIR